MKLLTLQAAAMAMAFTGAAATTPRAAHAQDLGLLIGTTAPNVTVTTLDGKSTDLSAYLGKTPTLIEFWATWCPNCKELEPTLKAMTARYGGRVQFVRIAVNVNESAGHVKAFVDKYDIPGHHYYDTSGDATTAYDVPATSYVVLIDRAGKVVYTGLGGTQDLDTPLAKVLR